MYKSKSIDLNTILKFLNLFIVFILFFSYYNNGDSLYVDVKTVFFGALLSLQIYFFLLLEKKRRDPFVLLLCLQMILYFLLRILTLYEYSFSVVFFRSPFSIDYLNSSLLFIIAANFALYLGLSMNTLKKYSVENSSIIPSKKSKLVLIPLAIGYFFSFYNQVGLSSLSAVISFLNGTFLNITIIIFMVLIYYYLFKNYLDKRIKFIIIVGVLLFVIIQTLIGSRSGILTMLNFILFAILGINNCLYIKRKYLIGFLVLAPLMVLIFAVTTFLRPRVENREKIGGDTIEVLKEFDFKSDFSQSLDLIIMGVSDRIGFLDYCTHIISSEEQYSGIFNLNFYSKSIIDNVLTPGFDIFDAPKASNALRFVYNKDGIPLKSKIGEAYQSDQFTFYGEFFALFGNWLSLVPIFLTGFLFKWFYINLKENNIYLFYLKRGIVLYVFYTMLNSFGLDWLCLDMLSIFFTYHIFKVLFKEASLILK